MLAEWGATMHKATLMLLLGVVSISADARDWCPDIDKWCDQRVEPTKSITTQRATAVPVDEKSANAIKQDSRIEYMKSSVRAGLRAENSDRAGPEPQFPSLQEKLDWLTEMSRRLEQRIPDREARIEFLKTVYFEAKRAGLDPQMVLALIEVTSGFKKYSVSSTNACGYMHVGQEWVKRIGTPGTNLYHLRTNLRYGCTLLRHYLDLENGDLYRALGRYNGSLGKPEYPNLVRNAWEKQWTWEPPSLRTPNGIQQAAATVSVSEEPGSIEVPIKDSRGCKTLMWSKEGSKSANPTLKWDGKCKNGFLHGKGKATLVMDSGTMTTTANFVSGREEGYGEVTTKYSGGDSSLSTGNFVHGRLEGYGEFLLSLANGETISFKGNFVHGKQTGKGKRVWSNGMQYEGNFFEGKFEGAGKYCWSNGLCLESEFAQGQPGRMGKLLYADGSVYAGQIDDYAAHGKGRLFNATTRQVYQGDFVKGQWDGAGVLENAGMRFQVTAKDGRIVETTLLLPSGETVPIRAEDVHPLFCEAFGSVVGSADYVKCRDILMATAVLRDEVESKKQQIAEYERIGKEIKAMMDEQNSRSRSAALLNYANETLKPTVLSPAPASPPIQKGTLQSSTRNCPTGSSPWTDEWGNKICKRFDSGQTTTVQGTLKNCPTGSSPWTDEWGNRVCKDFANNKQYYDTSKGCPTGTYQWTDDWGNRVCKSN